MFGSLTVYDGMTQILSRIFRVPVNNKPITIVELTGLPTEIVNVVVSVLARMTFDFAHWSEGKVPLTLVCEEAHRYVPASDHLGFEPCKRAIAKIAKEGRKYGVALCIVSQRPAEVDPTILSQCNTVFALRMSNDRDQEIVNSAITDTGSGLLEFLPSLGQREALAFGDGVALPVRIKFDELPANCLPRSTTARFTEHWQRSVGDEGFLEQVVEKWRTSDIGAGGDLGQHPAFLGDPFNPETAATPPPAAAEARRPDQQANAASRAGCFASRAAHVGAGCRLRLAASRQHAAGTADGRLAQGRRAAGAIRDGGRRKGRAGLGAEIAARSAHPASAALAAPSARRRLVCTQRRPPAAARSRIRATGTGGVAESICP